jgi:ribonuclease BN (tRNA processing enzyme)
LLELSNSKILLDCGSGSTWKLAGLGINYLMIDHLFLSHLHPDHTGDLVPFLFATKYAYGSPYGSYREKPLYLWGGEGFLNFFNTLREAYKDWIVPEALNVDELEESTKEFNDFTLTSVRTPHIESSMAYRIEEGGKSIVYSGDTDYSESFIELSTDTDVLLIECALASDESKLEGHLTPSKVIEIVNKSKAKKVVVTHLYPRCDQEKVVETIRANVGVEVIEAQDLLEIEI